MTALPIRIWLETNHQPSFRAGGWAFVLAEGSALSGAAGGERSPTGERIALAGLIEALKGAPAGAAVEIRTASPAVAAAWRRAATANPADPPAEDLELWAQLATALTTCTVRLAAAADAPRTPTAFAKAWAELGRDKAKTAPFRAAIPKANLAKAGVPA